MLKSFTPESVSTPAKLVQRFQPSRFGRYRSVSGKYFQAFRFHLMFSWGQEDPYFVMQYWIPGSPCSPRNTWSSRFLSARQIAQNQKRSKKFPTINTSQYSGIGEEIRDWPGLKDLTVSWWVGERVFDATEICELRLHTVNYLASLYGRKQHRTNNEAQNRIKWPRVKPRLLYTGKETEGPSLRKYNLFLYS